MSPEGKVGIFQENKGKNATQADRMSCSNVWLEQNSPYKDPCIKLHGQEATDDAGKTARDQMTKCILFSAKEYNFFLIADRGGVSKLLTKEEPKADLIVFCGVVGAGGHF